MAKFLPTIGFGRFNKGVNFADAVSVLTEGELLDAYNMTIDNIGALEKRLGYNKLYVSDLAAQPVVNLYYWKNQNKLVAQVGTEIHIDGSLTSTKTFTTAARVGFAEYDTSLYMMHPVDGLFKLTSGLALSGPIANATAGNSICVWQNRLWSNVAGSPRIVYSGIATPDTWTPEFTELRDKDGNPVTMIRAVSNGILCYKEDSAYHIYDSNTGAYNTIDYKWGAGSNIASVELHGRIYSVTKDGIFSTDGSSPMVMHSQRFQPYFPGLINTAREDLMCAGFRQDRLYFSMPLGANTVNTLEIEYEPLIGWMMPHSRAASCYAVIGDGSQKFGSPTLNGRVYNGFAPVGDDDGNAINSYAQTRFIEPLKGTKFRVRRARFTGLGAVTLQPFADYLDTPVASFPFAFGPSGPTYDDVNTVYDTDDYYTDVGFDSFGDELDMGVYKAISFRFEETSQATQIERSPGPVSEQTQIVAGAWSLSGIDVEAVQLGQT